jgi:phytoene synthase
MSQPIDGPPRSGAAALARGSSSFAAAARLLDRATRESVIRLYAWCRYCDDVTDGQVLGGAQRAVPHSAMSVEARVEALREATLAALGEAEIADPVFDGLRQVLRRHAIPAQFPIELIDGFAMDALGRSYATIEDTLSYAYHVAGVVGIMMAQVMGAREPAVLRRASDLGIAFQLSNIARDVIDDAAIGRVYLPDDWLREAGVPPGAVHAPEHRAAVARVVARLLDTAEPYYRSALEGIGALPVRNACAIAAAHGIYREIGVLVRRRGAGAWDTRARTTRMRKAMLAARGCLFALRRHAVPRDHDAYPRADLWTPPALRLSP